MQSKPPVHGKKSSDRSCSGILAATHGEEQKTTKAAMAVAAATAAAPAAAGAKATSKAQSISRSMDVIGRNGSIPDGRDGREKGQALEEKREERQGSLAQSLARPLTRSLVSSW